MGGGYWSTDTYTSSATTRKSSGVDDFQYSQENRNSIHPNLDPARIRNKPFQKLESRDSADHPKSNAVFVCFDVTGSNIQRAREAQKKLPNLMDLLNGTGRNKKAYLTDPQILIAANDDFHSVGKLSVQISDYESDNRIDDHIRNVNLVGMGGANNGESYDLIMYAAARKTILDCFEKRQKKGYFFMYADEPIFNQVSKRHVAEIFGDQLSEHIPIQTIIEELKIMYVPYVIWPFGGFDEAREQYIHLFGQEHVLTLQHPNLICELIGSVIGFNEGLVATADDIKNDLVGVGTGDVDAAAIASYVTTIDRAITLVD